MALLFEETNEFNEEITYYDSSNIEKALYDFSAQTLYITFKNNTIYKYHPVRDEYYYQFKECDSQGKFVQIDLKRNGTIITERIL